MASHNYLLTVAALFLCGVTCAADKPIKTLIVDGFSNHNWRLNTAMIKGILKPTGLFDVSVSTAPSSQSDDDWENWRPDFAAYDVVIQTCNDIGGGPKWPQPVQQDFEQYVRNGGRVFIYHAANNAFPDWEAYNKIIGIGWRSSSQGVALAVSDTGEILRIPQGEGMDTGHGPRVNAVITRLKEHPIHHGLPRKWLTPDIEIYYYPRGPAENIEVLSYAHDVETRMNWPMEWVVRYGEGIAYSSTYGHVWHDDKQPERMRCAAVQTLIIRALCWLAGRKNLPPMPTDFPTASSISIRPDIKHGKYTQD